MRKPSMWLVAAFIMLASGVCAAQGDARRGAEALAERYQEAYNAGDLQGVVDLYVDDGWLSADGVSFHGRGEILGYVQGGEAPVEGATLEIDTDEALGLGSASVDVLGEGGAGVAVTAQEGLAVARGSWAFVAPDGERVSGGHWVSANERSQGEWYLRWLITNTELPEPEGSP